MLNRTDSYFWTEKQKIKNIHIFLGKLEKIYVYHLRSIKEKFEEIFPSVEIFPIQEIFLEIFHAQEIFLEIFHTQGIFPEIFPYM